MAGAVALRPAEPGDGELLFRVYASTRAEELSVVPWGAAEKEAFLRAQFAAQQQWYSEHYTGASFDVIELDGEPCGRLYVHRGPRELRIVDIALLPLGRGNGVGSALLRELLAEADAAGQLVTIHVERLNPALRLYERLGFRLAEDKGVYLLLERPPAT
jgi:ribosomal protein S18 acetylase RimI-like enzyme